MLGYLIAGVLLIGGLTGFVAMERKAGADKVRAELQPKLEKCQESVRQANEAAKAVKAEGDKRVAEAAKGAAAARKAAQGAASEAARLRSMVGQPAPASACPAASAAAEVRKGLGAK